MKSITAILLLGVMSFANISFAGEPSFMKNFFLDGALDEIQAKYKGSLQKITCGNDSVKQCAQNNLKCDCYSVILSSMQWMQHTLLFIVSNKKIVLTLDRTAVEPRYYLTSLENAERFFEDNKPTAIYEATEDQYGFRPFLAVWEIKDGYISSSLVCPVQNNSGRNAIKGNLRSCKTRAFKMTRIEKFSTPKDLKLSTVQW